MVIEAVGLLGAGTTGTELAGVLLLNGFQIRVYDDFKDRLSICMAKLKWKFEEEGKESLLSSIELIQDISLFKGADIVIETINREMDERKIYFNRLKKIVEPGCIIALNTGTNLVGNSLEILDIAPERCLGLNFMKPAAKNKLVEIVRTENARDEAVEVTEQFLEKLGKKPVVVRDNPGAIAHRLLQAYFIAAFNVLAAGKGFPRDIDFAFTRISGAKMGPFELIDFLGLDKTYSAALKIYEMLGKPPRLEPSRVHTKLVQYGQLGKSSTVGIYIYEDGSRIGENPILANIIQYLGLRKASDEEIFASIFSPVLEEAKILASEIMVSEYDIETVAKIGFGWPKGIFGCYRENKELLTPKRKSEFENLDAF